MLDQTGPATEAKRRGGTAGTLLRGGLNPEAQGAPLYREAPTMAHVQLAQYGVIELA